MAVGKRLRFQIFRRDNFACRYCGLTAADGAVLEVDHINPRAEGGKDVPANLVTACEGCNSGKSDVPLHVVLIEDVPQADFRAAMAQRGGIEDDDPETTAATAWYSGFMSRPDPRVSGMFAVSLSYAMACGYSWDVVTAACLEAGSGQDPELRLYLPPGTPDDDDVPLELAYEEDKKYLSGFISAELCPLIRRAREAAVTAGVYSPAYRQIVRVTAGMARKYEQDPGRDYSNLRKWLDRLPGHASPYLVRATAEWDSIWHGRPGHAAVECPDEVLINAVSIALKEEIRIVYCEPCKDRNHADCTQLCDCEHPAVHR